MNDLLDQFESLKISAFSKHAAIQSFSNIRNVTIGPDSRIKVEVCFDEEDKNKKSKLPDPENHIQKQTKEHNEQINVENKQLEMPSLPYNLSFKKVIEEQESLIQEQVAKEMVNHQQKFLDFQKQQEALKKRQWVLKQQSIVTGIKSIEHQILQALEQPSMNQKNDEISKHYKKLAEERKQKDREQKERQRRMEEINTTLNVIQNNQKIFTKSYEEVSTKMLSCTDSKISAVFSNIAIDLGTLATKMEDIVRDCQKSIDNISKAQVAKSEEILNKINNISSYVSSLVDNDLNTENNAAETIQRAKPHQSSSVPQNVIQPFQQKVSVSQLPTNSNQQVKTVTVAKKNLSNQNIEQNITINNPPKIEQDTLSGQGTTAQPQDQKPTKEGTSKINEYASKDSILAFAKLQKYLGDFQESLKKLSEDSSLKQFKFDCKKAVNVPVNAISPVSKEHLLDKYQRLHSLISGKKVPIGEKSFIASQHPDGVAFCKDLLAKKFVMQGDLLISSNPDAAFSYALIIVKLWNEFPDFGKLLLAYFQKFCPYLVPLYIPKTKDQDEKDFYQQCGYHYVDGVLETQDKFLKRMTGIMRLYSAVLIMKDTKPEPTHGLNEAWRWLVSLISLPPRPDITATMLHVFLENAGSTMERRFGKQFYKLIIFITQKYLPKVLKIDQGGPVTRLEVMLQDYKKKRKFDEPSGMLPKHLL